jgi:hypothetical protein
VYRGRVTFNQTAEVLIAMPLVFCAVAVPIGLAIMLFERLTGRRLRHY